MLCFLVQEIPEDTLNLFLVGIILISDSIITHNSSIYHPFHLALS